MSANVVIEPEGADQEQQPLSTARRLLTTVQSSVCLAFLAFVVAIGLLAPVLAPKGPNVTSLFAVNAPAFSPHHLLGADSSGRDILARLMWGTRETLLACVIIVAVSLPLGVISGLVAGYYRGRAEAITTWIADVLFSLPGIVLLIALYSLTGPDIDAAMAVFGVLVAPTYFRLVRGIVLTVRNELYVDAAKVLGLSDLRIIGRHILSAVRGPVIIQTAFILGAGIGIEASIDYLGLGNPSTSSWGLVLQEAFTNIYNNKDAFIWPSLLITLTILALVLLGNSLRDLLHAGGRKKSLSGRQRKRLIAAHDVATEQAPRSSTRSPADRPLAEDAVLAIRGLRIGYRGTDGKINEVVRGVDLDVRAGEIHGLVGESGSGKSQIALSTLGILPKEALLLGGTIHLGGRDLLSNPRAMEKARGLEIAYVPQEPMSNLDPCFTVGAQLSYGLRATKKISRRDAKRQLLKLMDRVGIADPERVFDLYPHQISGGMAQRILICGAVAGDPKVIIADEPTTALDVSVQAEVLELLRGLRDERGMAMVFVTHNLGVVADICDTVSVMQKGEIVEEADVSALFGSPAHPYTQELLESSREVQLEFA